jgi:phage protein D
MANLKPTFALSIGAFNSNDSHAAGGLSRLVVDRDMNFAVDSAEVELFDRSGIALDDEVKIELGHDGERQTVFTGAIVEIRPSLSGARVLALGKMNRLLSLRTANSYEGRTAGDIVRDLVDQAGLDAGTIDNGPKLPRFAVDQHCSAYRFIKDLADRLGYELYADREGRIMFHALGAAAGLDAAGGGLLGAAAGAISGAIGSGGAETYQFGKSLIEGVARRGVEPAGKVSVGGESPVSAQGETTAHWLTTESDDFRGEAGDGDPPRLALDAAARTKDLADRFAAGYRATLVRASRQIFITTLGRPSLELGQTIEVGDIPDRLANGRGYIQAIRHSLGAETGFLTELRIVPEAGG